MKKYKLKFKKYEEWKTLNIIFDTEIKANEIASELNDHFNICDFKIEKYKNNVMENEEEFFITLNKE